MPDRADLLAAYDTQLRGEPEVRGAARVERLGPLWISISPSGRGFVTARDLDGRDERGVRALVAAVVGFFATEPSVTEAEWKTRGHDAAPGLTGALIEAGFLPEEAESIMIGAAELLALDLPVPEGIRLRAVTDPADVRRASAMADELFGETDMSAAGYRVDEALRRIEGGAELWVAEAGDVIVSSGRLEPVAGTAFAGIWGGATRPEWRRRGIYRAMTAERARSAVRRGVRYINSDSTEGSRPILERSGFVKVSTTTPYVWHR